MIVNEMENFLFRFRQINNQTKTRKSNKSIEIKTDLLSNEEDSDSDLHHNHKHRVVFVYVFVFDQVEGL